MTATGSTVSQVTHNLTAATGANGQPVATLQVGGVGAGTGVSKYNVQALMTNDQMNGTVYGASGLATMMAGGSSTNTLGTSNVGMNGTQASGLIR